MTWLRTLLLCLGSSSVILAAIDGSVVNKTTGKALSGAKVLLVKPGAGGMRTLGTVTTDANGHFSFENDEPGGGPQLLQVPYENVNYNKLLTPNLSTHGVELDVYEATKAPDVAHIAERMLLFEPTKSQIAINETIVVQNPSNRTYTNSNTGSIRFYLPPAANGQVRVNAQGPQGMPLPSAAERTEAENIFKVNFPIKPGETEFQILYVLPVGSPFDFHGEIANIKGMIAGPLRLVVPPGVTLAGKNISQVGVEPTTQATIYSVTAAKQFTASISGTGSLSGGDQTAAGENDESAPVTEGAPQIYSHMSWLLALIFGILAVGLIILFRTSPVRS
jgi:hypothetical protein